MTLFPTCFFLTALSVPVESGITFQHGRSKVQISDQIQALLTEAFSWFFSLSETIHIVRKEKLY
jgi:hypothetical protein